MYRLGIILILSCLFIQVQSQDVDKDSVFNALFNKTEDIQQTVTSLPELPKTKSVVEIMDSITYAQYLNKDYIHLIKTADKARKQGIDFYYLNYRTAIAYYELKNYAKAAEFYKKTLVETPNDAVLLESLYYAYLFSGQKMYAGIIASQLSPDRQKVIGYKPSAVDYLSLSGGYSFSGNNENVRNSLSGLDSINQYQNMAYGSFALGFKLGKRAALSLGYQQYLTKFERYKAGGLIKTENLTQHQGNFSWDYTSKNDFTLGIAGGVYSVERADKTMTLLSRNKKGNGFGGSSSALSTYTSTKNSDLSYAAMIYFSKRFTYIIPEIALAYSNLSFDTQYQGKFQLVYYPLGNLNFYGISSAAFIKNKNSVYTSQTVLSQTLGAKIVDNLWINANFSTGNHLNYIDNHTFVTYNTYDPIKNTAGVNLSYYFKKASVTCGYQWMQKSGIYYQNSNIGIQTYKYNNHIVKLSLSWDI